MKIAILSSTFPPYAGGIGNVAAANARELVKLGHDVTVFTPSYQEVEEEIKDINIERVPALIYYGNAAFIPSVIWMLKGYDIVHIHYPFFGGAETLWLYQRTLKKKFGVKIVVHYHMDVIGEGIFKTLFTIHRKLLLPKIIKMADKVIFTSMDYGIVSDLEKIYQKDEKKFIEIPNGVDSKRFTPQEAHAEILRNYSIDQNDSIVLFVGGLDKAHYFKGIEYLVEAMSRLKTVNYSWKLVIVGKGGLKDSYHSLSEQLGVDSRTVFTDYVSNKDLPLFYNLANIVVLPSVDKSEAFGLALVEAMSCGKAVIASDLPGVRSVVEDGVNGLTVTPKDANDLATKINYLLEHTDLANSYGQKGREKVEQKYDWEIIGKMLDNLYKSL